MQSMARTEASARLSAEDLQGSTVTTNGSACGGIAGLLHDGANVDLLVGQRGGNGGDDAGAVVDQEADVMGNLEFGADVRRR